MIRVYKTKLNLTNKQREQFIANAGCARWAYNYVVGKETESLKNNKYIPVNDLRKEVTKLKQTDELSWLFDYDCDIVKQSMKDADKAFKTFFKNKEFGFPKFHSKHSSKQSFYVDGVKLKVWSNKIRVPKVGYIKLYEKDYIPTEIKCYYNPRITFDGIDWFISVGVKEDDSKKILEGEIIGIDLGLKELATCSNGLVIHNISKSKRYKKLEKRFKRQQRQMSRSLERNKKGKKFIKTKNYEKYKKKYIKTTIKMNNVKTDYFNKSIVDIMKAKCSTIVLEDLTVKNMQKNRKLSDSFQKTSVSQFRSRLIQKATMLGVTVSIVSRFFPSSRICSNCGHVKKDLTLADRVYKCEHCGLEIDRDLNASINLKNTVRSTGI